ncbi:hypothetical protein PUMCH_001872 [Australozyma saopauloensis]|uniref:Zinc finger PHD-type domain-containing protein n=1 Tax=Australozyma saopauloensis TaxID=291208 RepID=A0AAX4H7Q3_9ASCO|nr:hypothetical protein PUMCH_001872 [[Candida] saopauloensis]
MSEKNEDQQLLADASTLLMFATAAARQASPGTGLPGSASESQPSAAVADSPAAVTSEKRTSLVSERTPLHSAGSANSAMLAYPVASTFVTLSLLATEPQPLLPPMHAEAAVPTTRLQPYPEQGLHPPYVSQHAFPGHVPANAPAQQMYPGPNVEYKMPPIHPQYPYGVVRQHPQLPEGHQQMPVVAPEYGPPEATFRTRYRTLSPKDVSSASDPAQKLNLSPRYANVPVQGTFHLIHKRTSSEGSHQYRHQPVSNHSPPASLNVALARGINVESRERRTDNAKIAAAALAAAADIPLPLRRNSDLKKTDLELHDIKKEDPSATDVELDENKTDIEPESETGESVKNEPLPPHISLETKTQKLGGRKSTGRTSAKASKDSPDSFICPPLASYKVEPDAGIIGCICEINEDDGFTIQCDICFRWQHCSCMGFKTSDEVPEDEYKCYYCDKNKWNKFDASICRAETARRLESENQNEPEPPTPKRKTLNGGNDDSRKRRRSEKDAKVPAERVANEKRKSTANLLSTASPNTSAVIAFEINNKDNPLLEDGVTAESYQSIYYKLTENDFKTTDVKLELQKFGSSVLELLSNSSPIEKMSSSQFETIRLCYMILPNLQKQAQEKGDYRRGKGFNKFSLRVKPYSENPKQKFAGISKESLYITDMNPLRGGENVVPVGTPIIEYLGELDFLELYMRNRVNQYSVWGTMKPKVVRIDLALSSDNESVSIVIDSRYEGNESRFIRKSCSRTANCEIKPVYISDLNTFRFLIVTTRPIELKGEDLEEELRLNWEWDDSHPIKDMLKTGIDGDVKENKKFDDFNEEEKNILVTGVNTMLNFVECACNTTAVNSQCPIFKVKKATSYLLRSTRKASSLINTSSNKSKDDLVLPTNRRQFVSWQERLKQRENALLVQYFGIQEKNEDDLIQDDAVDSETLNEVKEGHLSVNTRETKIPPRVKILTQSKKFGVNSPKVVPGSQSEIGPEIVLDSSKISVPLTNDVLASIREQVMQVLRPAKEPSQNDRSPKIQTDSKPAHEITTPLVSKPAHSKENSPLATQSEQKEASITEHKPLVVKKLSFADYKKKMK